MKRFFLSILVILTSFMILPSACGGGGGRYYQPAATPPTLTLPNAPYNLTAEAVSYSTVKLQWIDSSDNEEGFRIYRGNDIVATVGPNINIYQDTGLRPATTCHYVVKAYNQAGESATPVCAVKTLNPPITVRLDRIGVYDNGEHWLRGGAGEVYVGIIVTDGNTVVEKQFPEGEGQFYKLYENETVDVGTIIFSVDEVGDYVRIAAVGYEADGGPGETLIYQALGAAAEGYLSGGAASLLEMTGSGLGNILAKLFGAEDDWLGSYENAWDSDSDWGIGRYTDITCEEEDGTLGLRLWFTIESPWEALTLTPSPTAAPTPAPSPTPAPTPSGVLLMTDNVNLAPFDEEAIEEYIDRHGYPSKCPFNMYGVFVSELFSLNANDTVIIELRSNTKICVEESECDCGGNTLSVWVFHRKKIDHLKSGNAQIISCEVNSLANTWEARVTFRARETGSYQFQLTNFSGEYTWCEFTIYLK